MPKRFYKERADESLERSGKLYEHFLLGDITTGKNHERYLNAVRKYTAHLHGAATQNYIPFQEALCIVREAQRENPHYPQRRFLKDLYDAIFQRLNKSSRNRDALSIYSAVGSPLDHIHGVDAVVEFAPPQAEGETRLVTLDASLNPAKKEDGSYKADILIERLDADENPREYKESIERIAHQIIERLQ